ncbi:hypothetical protein IT413_01805 [Candidatus Peregrinibacteria bacterium]|nr:hypothetical protein [Candidatus Peregrinibacteria bacterium]
MLDYSRIKNDRLKELIMHSESIHAQPENVAQEIINNIAALDPEKEQESIQMFESEQKEIQSAKLARGITPDMEIQYIEQNQKKLTEINKEYDTGVRKYQEEKTQKQDEKEAEDLLNQLNNT